jgi:chitinase
VKSDQTIDFPALPDAALTDSPVTASATASSGLPVTYSTTTPSVCDNTDASITLLAPGTCIVQADQPGDDNFNPAPAVQRQFTVTTMHCVSPCISVGDASVLEGDAGTHTLRFAVTLSDPSASAVTVNYQLGDGTATGAKKAAPNVDYLNGGGLLKTLTFKPPTMTSLTPIKKFVAVSVLGDTTVEGDETLTLTLSNPSAPYTLARAQGIGTIINDDGTGNAITIGIGDSMTAEGSTGGPRALKFPVTLSAKSATALSLTYVVTPLTAQYGKKATVPGADFGGAQSGTLNFNLGLNGFTGLAKTISIPVWPDTVFEPDEQLQVTITGPGLPTGTAIIRSVGTGTILNDDAGSALALSRALRFS